MGKIRHMLLSGMICSVIVLPGCVSQKQDMIREGYPPSYAAGFDDGCHSGKKAGGSMFDQFRKDVVRFQNDPQYAQGWSDGFRQCETEEEAMERQTRIAIEQQRLLEQKKHDHWEEKQYHYRKKHPRSKEQKMLEKSLEGVDTKELERKLKDKYQ